MCICGRREKFRECVVGSGDKLRPRLLPLPLCLPLSQEPRLAPRLLPCPSCLSCLRCFPRHNPCIEALSVRLAAPQKSCKLFTIRRSSPAIQTIRAFSPDSSDFPPISEFGIRTESCLHPNCHWEDTKKRLHVVTTQNSQNSTFLFPNV